MTITTRENFGKTVEAAMNVIMLEMGQVWYNQSILKLKFTKKKIIGFLESNLNQLTTVHKQLVKYKMMILNAYSLFGNTDALKRRLYWTIDTEMKIIHGSVWGSQSILQLI